MSDTLTHQEMLRTIGALLELTNASEVCLVISVEEGLLVYGRAWEGPVVWTVAELWEESAGQRSWRHHPRREMAPRAGPIAECLRTVGAYLDAERGVGPYMVTINDGSVRVERPDGGESQFAVRPPGPAGPESSGPHPGLPPGGAPSRSPQDPAPPPAHEAPDRPTRVGVVGAGYWGPKIARNLATLPEAELLAVCDRDPARLPPIGQQYPDVQLTTDFDALLAGPVEAVVIATPVKTHFSLVKRALHAGKHVLVEKPLTASAQEAAELVQLAETRGLVLMVGHTYVFEPAVEALAIWCAAASLARSGTSARNV